MQLHGLQMYLSFLQEKADPIYLQHYYFINTASAIKFVWRPNFKFIFQKMQNVLFIYKKRERYKKFQKI